MSQLIEMRRRIKAVDTTQKITHAMQLVAMSTRLRLREKSLHLDEYHRELTNLLQRVQSQVGPSENHILFPEQAPETNPLLIIVGASKGLCGTFNMNIILAATRELKDLGWKHANVMILGKKLKDYLPSLLGAIPFPVTVKHSGDLTSESAEAVAAIITQTVYSASPVYTTVKVLSSYPVGFFVQKQKLTTLLPQIPVVTPGHEHTTEPFIWHHNPQQILDTLSSLHLRTSIQHLLLQSLLAEHAARFVSMDSATRNAKSLKETMVLQFNKLRQWKITKELTELSSSF